MFGLRFEAQAPVIESNPNRTDIACFVGFIGRRQTQVPAVITRWLAERNWTVAHLGREPLEALLDVPVPIDTWDVFDHLFAWEARPLDISGQIATSYLGAAVRSFFAQGGRKCYVVRVGEPWNLLVPPTASGSRQERMLTRLSQLMPGYPLRSRASPVEQESWRGIGHLFGLPDVSFLCLPDLADSVGIEAHVAELPEPLPGPPEQFVECSEPVRVPLPDRQARFFQAPRCDDTGYDAWVNALRVAGDIIARYQREVQLIAAVPIPAPGSDADRDLLTFLDDRGRGPLALSLSRVARGVSSAFVQLAYPWVRTPGSVRMPEQLESPDAVLAGILARNALTRGAFRSAASLNSGDVYDVYPALERDTLWCGHPRDNGTGAYALVQRVSLFGRTPGGLRLLSDVTTSLDERYRPANVNRLVATIVRAARRLGEDVVFEASSELLWLRMRERLEHLLRRLLRVGALRGAIPAEAFQVRCDRSTMSQQDIDEGRVIAEVVFEAAAAIEQITVVLALDEGGQVSLVG